MYSFYVNYKLKTLKYNFTKLINAKELKHFYSI